MQERKEKKYESGTAQWTTQSKSFLGDEKSQIFINHFKQEFIYELEYICALDAGRGVAPRDSFYTMIAKQMKEIASSLPFGDTAINAVDKISAVINTVEEKKRDGRVNIIAELGKKLDHKKLEILLDIAAREAFIMYEPSIKKLKDEFVAADFARVGVRRIFEYLSREGNKVNSIFPLDKSIILIGLIEGHSGFGVEDHRNTQLKLKNNPEIPEISAETIYGRSGFQTIKVKIKEKVKESSLEQVLFIRNKGKHKEGSKWKIFKELVKGNTEALYDFGYAKPTDDKHKEIPRAGYIVVSQEIIDRYAYYKQATSTDNGEFKPEDEYEKIDPKMKAELIGYTPSILEIDKQTLIKFLSWSKNNGGKSILEYLHEVLKLPPVSYAKCRESLNTIEDKIDCTHANFSNIDLSGVTLTGDYSGAKFVNSYLVGTYFNNVTAHDIDLTNARCELLKANDVKFNNATLNLTHFDYAEFNKCDFSGCNHMGSTWLNATLQNSVGDNHESFESEINKVKEELKKSAEKTEAELLELHNDIRMSTQELYEAQKTILDHIAELTIEQDALRKELKETVEDLFRQKESYIKFKKFCKEQFKQISNTHIEHSKQIEKINKQLGFFEKELHKIKDDNVIKDILKKFKEELSHLTDEVSELKKSSLEIVKKQEEAEKKQEQVETTQKDHGVRLTAVEFLVADLNKKEEEKKEEKKKEEEKKEELFFPKDPEKIELLTNELTGLLKEKYQKKGEVKAILSNRTLNILDIHLTLNETKKEKTGRNLNEEKNGKTEFSQWEQEKLEYYEQPYQQSSIDLENIFDEKREGSSKRIIISGAPGTGKTTLCEKMLYEWSICSVTQESKSSLSLEPSAERKSSLQSQVRTWNKFNYVFCISLRSLKDQKDKALNLEKVILDQNCGETKNSELRVNTISYVLTQQGNSCLLILDGIDEVAHLLEGKEEKSESIVKKLIKQIFGLKCYIVTTTRPYRITGLESLMGKEVRKFENCGFSDKQIKEYIINYFNEEKEDHEKSKGLTNFLEGNSRIWGASHIPINLSLICLAWSKPKPVGELFTDQMSMTDLYQNVSCYFLDYFLKEKKNVDTLGYPEEFFYSDANCKAEVRFLQVLAFITLKEGEIEFSEKYINQAATDKTLTPVSFISVLDLGFLRTIGFSSGSDVRKKHHFHHLTFHEFFAARYIKESLEKKYENTDRYNLARDFILENRYVDRYQVLFGFVAGLLSYNFQNRSMHDFWNIILSEPLDLTRIGHLRLIIRCLEEAKCHESIPNLRQILGSVHDVMEKTSS